MAELNVILESLRRQRKDLHDLGEDTLSRTSETAALIEKIENLRTRSEKTERLFQSEPAESRRKPGR
jgi:hypothetical protein